MVDPRADTEGERATGPLSIAHISTVVVPPGERAALISDELAARLTAGRAAVLGIDTVPAFDWLHLDLGAGTVLADARVEGLGVARSEAMARAGDGDVSLFVALTDGVRFDQNRRRTVMARGDGLFVAHGRAVRSEYTGSEHVAVVKLPREAVGGVVPIERAGGLRLDGRDEAMVLLRAYLAAVMERAGAGAPPSAMARRHLAELVRSAVLHGLGADDPTPGGGRAAARLERMLRFIEQYHARPGLTMREVSAAAGVSARSGYLAFAAAGIDFTDHVIAVRLARAKEYLESPGAAHLRVIDVATAVGFSDLSHFNRRFRQRYGATPREARDLAVRQRDLSAPGGGVTG